MGVVDEVRGGDLVARVGEDALEVGFARFLHRGANFLVARVPGRLDREVDDGDGRRGNAERHAGELALNFGQNQTDGPGGAGGRGDDVDRRGASALPVLLRGAVHRLLRGGVAVDRGHQAFLDTEAFLEQDVDDGGQTGGGATRSGDDLVRGDV